MLLLNCDNCDKKKSTFIKDKELQNFKNISNDYFKMNKILNKFLLTGDKFIPGQPLKQSELTYNACRPLLNITKGFENLEKEVI